MNDESVAAAVSLERVVASREFGEARALVLESAAAECRPGSVARLREIGGYSAAVARAIDALPAEFSEPGRGWYGFSVVQVLRLLVSDLRAEVQARVVARAEGNKS